MDASRLRLTHAHAVVDAVDIGAAGVIHILDELDPTLVVE